jgi:hypothetical protein
MQRGGSQDGSDAVWGDPLAAGTLRPRCCRLNREQFVGTDSAAVSVLAGPPLSAAPVFETIDGAASERALLTTPG